MSKLFLFMMISLDGFFEGPNHELDWHNVNQEFVDFAVEQTNQVRTILFGRRTYELMANYWPTEQARKSDPQTAALMNTTPKIVFSHSMDKVEETKVWKNIRLVKTNAVEQIKALKNEGGKDIAIFGSNNLAVNLIPSGIIDEFRIMINPVIIETGHVLFTGLHDRLNLKLQNKREFKNGNILLAYTM